MSSSEFRPGSPGAVFRPDTGKLYLFDRTAVFVLAPWPKPMAWSRSAAAPAWHNVRPDTQFPVRNPGSVPSADPNLGPRGQYLLPFVVPERAPSLLGQAAWNGYTSLIPEEIRDALRPFSSRHFHLLSMLARCGPAALDLTRSNPALAYMLASSWVYHQPAVKWPLRSVRALLRPGKKQRDILEWLRFPRTESGRRLTAKVEPGAASISGLLSLRQQMEHPTTRKLLGHLPRLNAGVLRLATDPELRPYVTPRVVWEVASMASENVHPRTAFLLHDAMRLHAAIVPDDQRFCRMHSVKAITELHDELTAAFNVRSVHDLDQLLSLEFPQPPVPGTETIVPLTHPRMLVEEGREQEHCVGSYAEEVATCGDVYVYRVLLPERCTVAIRRRYDGWVVSDLLAARNRPVSDATQLAVRDWLARSGTSEPRRSSLQLPSL